MLCICALTTLAGDRGVTFCGLHLDVSWGEGFEGRLDLCQLPTRVSAESDRLREQAALHEAVPLALADVEQLGTGARADDGGWKVGTVKDFSELGEGGGHVGQRLWNCCR
ncbi:protein of unknown function [Thauera humireducens]|nr:protein of unknown function [Thauera humireducens]